MKKHLLQISNNKKLFPVWFLLAAAAFIYGLYAFYYTYLDWNELLLVGLNSALAGAGFAVTVLLCACAKKEDSPKAAIKALIFAGGLVFFEALLWGILSIVNVDGLYNRKSIYTAYAVITVMFTAMAMFLFICLSKSVHKPLNALLASFCVPALLIIAFLPVKNDVKYWYFALMSTGNIVFQPITANAAQINAKERERCLDWYNANILKPVNGLAPAFNFHIGDTDFRTLYKNGEVTVTNTYTGKPGESRKNGVTTKTEYRISRLGVTVLVESTLYEQQATCEWTVYIKNTADTDSGIISDFYAAQCTFENTAGDIYFSRGSSNNANDFMLNKVSSGIRGLDFETTEGRSSDTFLPYFNFCGKNGGVVAAIGWTGMWKMKVTETGENVNVVIGQKNLRGCLTPGEEIRSPLVSFSFYNGDNAVKGFNTFRSFMTDCVYPGWAKSCTMLETAGPESTRTSNEILEILDSFEDSVFENTDYFWMDAGWYKYSDNWSDGVGNWTCDTSRYDNGIAQLANYGKEKGLGQVLWYEPERVLKDTVFYRKGIENEGWLLDNGTDTWCFNLANSDALAWFTEYLASSMKENGVTFYRQDQNFDLSVFFEAGDEKLYGGREGFCENHYIVGEYQYLDSLTKMIPGLKIDNCASGGRRLDLEMARRSIPIWRSDYNCDSHPDLMEATQSQTLGLSCWLPLSGTLKYCANRYEAATTLIPCYIETFGTVNSEFFNSYSDLRSGMTEKYYPLVCGGVDNNKFLAMEFASADGTSGFTVSYRRAECDSDTLDLVFSGLIPEKTYTMHDYYAPDIKFSATGEELMTTGLKHTFTGSPDVIIIVFEAQ